MQNSGGKVRSSKVDQNADFNYKNAPLHSSITNAGVSPFTTQSSWASLISDMSLLPTDYRKLLVDDKLAGYALKTCLDPEKVATAAGEEKIILDHLKCRKAAPTKRKINQKKALRADLPEPPISDEAEIEMIWSRIHELIPEIDVSTDNELKSSDELLANRNIREVELGINEKKDKANAKKNTASTPPSATTQNVFELEGLLQPKFMTEGIYTVQVDNPNVAILASVKGLAVKKLFAKKSKKGPSPKEEGANAKKKIIEKPPRITVPASVMKDVLLHGGSPAPVVVGSGSNVILEVPQDTSRKKKKKKSGGGLQSGKENTSMVTDEPVVVSCAPETQKTPYFYGFSNAYSTNSGPLVASLPLPLFSEDPRQISGMGVISEMLAKRKEISKLQRSGKATRVLGRQTTMVLESPSNSHNPLQLSSNITNVTVTGIAAMADEVGEGVSNEQQSEMIGHNKALTFKQTGVQPGRMQYMLSATRPFLLSTSTENEEGALSSKGSLEPPHQSIASNGGISYRFLNHTGEFQAATPMNDNHGFNGPRDAFPAITIDSSKQSLPLQQPDMITGNIDGLKDTLNSTAIKPPSLFVEKPLPSSTNAPATHRLAYAEALHKATTAALNWAKETKDGHTFYVLTERDSHKLNRKEHVHVIRQYESILKEQQKEHSSIIKKTRDEYATTIDRLSEEKEGLEADAELVADRLTDKTDTLTAIEEAEREQLRIMNEHIRLLRDTELKCRNDENHLKRKIQKNLRQSFTQMMQLANEQRMLKEKRATIDMQKLISELLRLVCITENLNTQLHSKQRSCDTAIRKIELSRQRLALASIKSKKLEKELADCVDALKEGDRKVEEPLPVSSIGKNLIVVRSSPSPLLAQSQFSNNIQYRKEMRITGRKTVSSAPVTMTKSPVLLSQNNNCSGGYLLPSTEAKLPGGVDAFSETRRRPSQTRVKIPNAPEKRVAKQQRLSLTYAGDTTTIMSPSSTKGGYGDWEVVPHNEEEGTITDTILPCSSSLGLSTTSNTMGSEVRALIFALNNARVRTYELVRELEQMNADKEVMSTNTVRCMEALFNRLQWRRMPVRVGDVIKLVERLCRQGVLVKSRKETALMHSSSEHQQKNEDRYETISSTEPDIERCSAAPEHKEEENFLSSLKGSQHVVGSTDFSSSPQWTPLSPSLEEQQLPFLSIAALIQGSLEEIQCALERRFNTSSSIPLRKGYKDSQTSSPLATANMMPISLAKKQLRFRGYDNEGLEGVAVVAEKPLMATKATVPTETLYRPLLTNRNNMYDEKLSNNQLEQARLLRYESPTASLSMIKSDLASYDDVNMYRSNLFPLQSRLACDLKMKPTKFSLLDHTDPTERRYIQNFVVRRINRMLMLSA